MTTGVLVFAFGMMASAALAEAAACRDDQIQLRWQGGLARFAVEVADDADERSQGLMHREKLSTSAGMLFVYERPQRAQFWMANTLIPLDMIFADASGRVTRVHANAKPKDRTTIDGGEGVQFVLEINGGLAKRLGIAEGAEMQHPAIKNAAWPCDAE
ncbi:DUF192 domain-containing protein [Thioclava sp. FR2]|uniref:DUF192 domain-containing protein n=1 Tax=Thioclava sp. FR2 TaxID=3445780 RepID=UPI003EB76D1A